MLFLNEMEIESVVHLFGTSTNSNLSKAVCFLSRFCAEVNAHSDGWAYWKQPVRAAAQLMTLVQHARNCQDRRNGFVCSHHEAVTEASLKAAITPIKAFYTRRGTKAGMKFPEGIL